MKMKLMVAAMLVASATLHAANAPVPTDPFVISTDTATYGKRPPEFTKEITVEKISEDSIVKDQPRSTRYVISK